jgi:RNA polymerase sigma-70 factor, ECF subfamily
MSRNSAGYSVTHCAHEQTYKLLVRSSICPISEDALMDYMELSFSDVLGIEMSMAAWDTEEQKQAAFAAWALPHKDAIYSACLYLARQRDDAEDLFQETFLRAFRFFHHFTPGTNCRAWLLTIMHNMFKTGYVRNKRIRQTVDFDLAAYEYDEKRLRDGDARHNDPADLLLSHLVDSEITDALAALPEEYRIALVLVDIEELTYDEAASVLGCPIGTVRSRLARARRRLRAALTTYAEERGYIRKAHTQNNDTIPAHKTETKL